MDQLYRIQLRILPTESVLPHEVPDPSREQRIQRRLQDDGLLRDPILVGAVPDLTEHILLDGTNRQRALARLGLPRVLAQVLDYADHHAVQLHTWCHAALTPIAEILAGVKAIPGLATSSLPPLAAPDALHDPATLAVLLDKTQRYVLTRLPNQAIPRAEHLRQLVCLYEAQMRRVDCAPDDVEERTVILSAQQDHPVTLIAFPRFSRSQVVTMALQRSLIPAGITRHIISSGRALRVNLPLEVLRGTGNLEQANRDLQRYLDRLHPRIYREPTVLFDS